MSSFRWPLVLTALLTLVLVQPPPARALIIAESADDVCDEDDDPCIVDEEVDVVDGSELDFGTRTVRVEGAGVFDFEDGDGIIACGDFEAEVSGNAIKAKGSSLFGTEGGSIGLYARRPCSLNAAVPCVDDNDCTTAGAGLCTGTGGTVSLDGKILGNADSPARILIVAAGDVDILGQITVASTSADYDGGTITIQSSFGSIAIADNLELTSGAFGTGGTVLLQAAEDIDVDAVIDANGGDFDGGLVALAAGGDVTITEDITANAVSGAGFGGEIDVQADGNITIVGGGAANRLNLSTDGHQSSENFAGDGGIQTYDAGGTIDVSQYARFDANGSPPDGFGEQVSFTAVGGITIAGQVISKAKGNLGGGGSVELYSDGDVVVTGTGFFDVTGQASGGGDVRIEIDGNLTFAGSADASGANGGVAGRFLADVGTDAAVSGALLTGGASSSFSHGELEVEACRVVVSGSITNLAELGENLLVGRERITVSPTGSLTASGSGASNTFEYRDAAKPPIVQGAVSPSPVLVVDSSLVGCPVCGNFEKDQGESCDDGNLTGGDGCNPACQDEGCIAQTPGYPAAALCDDGNQCTDDACNDTLHACAHVANSCSDGIACTSDACAINVCTHTPVNAQCDDSNPCTADTCSTTVGCVHPAQANSCDDGVFCNGTDSCSGGTCSSHAGDPCTGGAECADVCNETADACLTPAGTVCTSDGNVCTNDVCDGAGACSHPHNTAPCVDGLFCNGADTCAGGSCSQHAGDPCAGGSECSDECNEGGDHCLDPGGTACSDDGNECTDDECSGSGTCAHPANTGTCDDLNFCTVDDSCGGGSCNATPAPLLDVAGLKAQLKPYDDDDRMGVKGTFALSALSVSPVDTGLRLVVGDLNGTPLYDATVPAGAFEAASNGTVYRFKAASTSAAGGILKASLKAITTTNVVKLRLKIGGVDLADVVGADRLTAAVVFGDEPGTSPCTGSLPMDCDSVASKISCQSP